MVEPPGVDRLSRLPRHRPELRHRVERVLNGTAYATLVEPAGAAKTPPITAESQAEQPTRRRTRGQKAELPAEVEPAELPAEVEPETSAPKEDRPARRTRAKKAEVTATAEVTVPPPEEAAPRKKARRGSRGGRGRKRKTEALTGVAALDGDVAEREVGARIHLPSSELGENVTTAGANGDPLPSPAATPPAGETEPVEGVQAGQEVGPPEEPGGEADSAPRKRKTRRGSRGGRSRKRKTPAPSTE